MCNLKFTYQSNFYRIPIVLALGLIFCRTLCDAKIITVAIMSLTNLHHCRSCFLPAALEWNLLYWDQNKLQHQLKQNNNTLLHRLHNNYYAYIHVHIHTCMCSKYMHGQFLSIFISYFQQLQQWKLSKRIYSP